MKTQGKKIINKCPMCELSKEEFMELIVRSMLFRSMAISYMLQSLPKEMREDQKARDKARAFIDERHEEEFKNIDRGTLGKIPWK